MKGIQKILETNMVIKHAGSWGEDAIIKFGLVLLKKPIKHFMRILKNKLMSKVKIFKYLFQLLVL